jgi:hypothetical protein
MKNIINPLQQQQIKKLEAIGFEDLARKVDQLAEEITKIKDQCFFGKEMTVNVCNVKEKVEQCFCKSYYDDDGVLMDCTCGKCGKPDKTECEHICDSEEYNPTCHKCGKRMPNGASYAIDDYEYFENKAVEEYKLKLLMEIEDFGENISSEKNPRWVKNKIVKIIETLK